MHLILGSAAWLNALRVWHGVVVCDGDVMLVGIDTEEMCSKNIYSVEWDEIDREIRIL